MKFPIVEKLDLPDGLLALVQQAYAADPTSSQGFTGPDGSGIWSSPKDFLKYREGSAALNALAKKVLELATAQNQGGYVLTAWANSIKAGQTLAQHDHVKTSEGPNAWAAVYYVRSPGGKLVFGEKAYSPKTGDLYFFPADMVHEVPAFEAEQSRISIAFNVRAVTE